MDQRPMPEGAGHMAADNPDSQRRCEHRHRQFRAGMDQPDQSDMQPSSCSSPLVRPVTTLEDVEYDKDASCCDGQMMPG